MNGFSDVLHRGLLCLENELCSRPFPVESGGAHSRDNKAVFARELNFIQQLLLGSVLVVLELFHLSFCLAWF